ncbi:hypothetical protein ACFU8W_48405 [Streptomyces sp. NPDC057565]|uniref:hypothetical protein n=1 Tax=Streptomyces sp. NPDC057565 TaxID=3346169 RepID=UPI0036CFB5CE
MRPFSVCSFWCVPARTHAGNLDEARLIFDKLLTSTCRLGLYAGQTSHNAEQLGHFPQAFTRLSLTTVGLDLDCALG